MLNAAGAGTAPAHLEKLKTLLLQVDGPSTMGFVLMVVIAAVIIRLLRQTVPVVSGFTPQSGRQKKKRETRDAYNREVMFFMDQYDTDLRDYMAALPPRDSAVTITATPELSLRELTSSDTDLKKSELAFPGLPVVFRYHSEKTQNALPNTSIFFPEGHADEYNLRNLATTLGVAQLESKDTTFGSLLLGTRMVDTVGPTGVNVSYPVHHASRALNPALVLLIPREAVIVALLIFRARYRQTINSRLIQRLMECRVLLNESSSSWIELARTFIEDYGHLANAKPILPWYCYVDKDGHRRVRPDIQQDIALRDARAAAQATRQSDDESNDSANPWYRYGPQSGEVDDTEMDESLTDMDTSEGAASTASDAAPVTKNIKSHSSTCAASQTKSVDPASMAGFSSFGTRPPPARVGGGRPGTSQDTAKVRFSTLNKGTRFERQVRDER